MKNDLTHSDELFLQFNTARMFLAEEEEEEEEEARLVVSLLDVTERKRAAEQIIRLNRIYALLSNINQTIVRVHDIDRLFNEICRIAVEDGKFLIAWIGMVNTDSKKVEVVASAGFTSDYLGKINIDLNDEKRSQGPTGRTIISGSHFISNDIEHDENMIPWREDALKLGYRSSASFPIKVFGKVSGVFNMYSSEVGFFNKDEIKLLDELATDISFALEFIEREAQRKQAEESLHQAEENYRGIFENAVEGIYQSTPEGLFLSVNPAMVRIFGYETPEHMVASISNIAQQFYVEPTTRLALIRALKEMGVVLGLVYQAYRKDGSIIWVTENARGVRDTNGVLLFFEGFIEDITERKQAEEAILKLSYQNKLILNSLGEGVYGLDSSGKTFFINPAAAAMLGYTVEELIGKSMHEIMHHTKADGTPYPREECLIYAAFKNGVEYRVVDEVFWKKDGTSFPVEYVSTPIQEHDVWIGAVVVFKDITERKRAEEELKISHKTYLGIINSLTEAIYIQDENGVFLEVNKAAEKFYGHPKEYFIGKTPELISAPGKNDIPMIAEAVKKAFNGELQSFEFWGLRKNGTIFPKSVNLTSGEYFGKKVVIATARDITEPKRAEEEIISQKNRFAQLFENSPIAIVLLDDQDKVVHINESFSALFGYFLEEVKGESLNDLIVPTELKEEAKSYSDQTREGDQINKESYRKKKDGTLVYVQIIGVPVSLNDSTVGIYGMYVDLTERKDAEEKMRIAKELAEQSDKMKTEFLAQMSHEIRTPINIITSNVNFIGEELGDKIDPSDKDCFESIELASRRIIRTVDLILNMSELQTGIYKPSLSKVDIDSQVLKKLYNEFQRTAKQKGIDFIYKCEVNESEIISDEYCVTQIFVNLVDNAIKYTKKGKVEILLTRNKDGNIVVEVKDTGIGMSKEFLPHLFEPFVQEDQGYSRSYEGNGLGLALVKRYCDINNAVIEVESEKGIGTTFRVIFK